MQLEKPNQDATADSHEAVNDSCFREEAIKHYFREPESVGVVHTSARWPWQFLVISTLLVVAAIVFICTARLDIVELVEGVLYVRDTNTADQSPSGGPVVVAFLPVEKSNSLHLGDSVQVAARAVRGGSILLTGDLVSLEQLGTSAQTNEKTHDTPAASMQLAIKLRVLPDQSSVTLYNGMPVTVHVTLKQQRLIGLLGSIRRGP